MIPVLVWSEERVAVLMIFYPKGILTAQEIAAMLNQFTAGPELKASTVRAKAGKLGLRMPVDAAQKSGRRGGLARAGKANEKAKEMVS